MYPLKRLLQSCASLLFLLVMVGGVRAQQSTGYAVKANIIYRFTKYINWPDDHKGGDFTIGIVGETPLYEELKSFVANKTANGRKIVVRKLTAVSPSFNCEILFISEDARSSLKKIAPQTEGTPVLLVTESEGLARRGACINFALVDEHLRLEINKNNIEKRNLGIASELLQLGILVK